MNFDRVVSVKTKPDQTDVEDKLKSLLVYRKKKNGVMRTGATVTNALLKFPAMSLKSYLMLLNKLMK